MASRKPTETQQIDAKRYMAPEEEQKLLDNSWSMLSTHASFAKWFLGYIEVGVTVCYGKDENGDDCLYWYLSGHRHVGNELYLTVQPRVTEPFDKTKPTSQETLNPKPLQTPRDKPMTARQIEAAANWYAGFLSRIQYPADMLEKLRGEK
jgi:hypothetical protein